LDEAFFAWLEANMPALNALDAAAIARAVRRSCELKAQIVAQDETESSTLGLRALLNFGHTFGHAFESALGYGTWLHGEAVGYGMVCAAVLSQSLGLLDAPSVARIRAIVAAANLPTQWPSEVTADAALAAMQLDKKTSHGALNFIVLDALGRSHVRAVEAAQVRAVIAQLQAA
jgi:3-dehydroquinate synthase